MRPVQVLISTYNGARFLRPLLDSVLNQDYPAVHVLIRDDGSTDETAQIIEEYCARPNVRAVYEQNIGAARSFLRLLELTTPGAAWVAFGDQDDVWEPDKLSRAVALLTARGAHEPRMYCGRAKVVDEHLRLIGLTRVPPRRPSFRNALVQNIAAGCTVVLNARAVQLLLRAMPSHAVMHDWWAYIVVSALGEVIYDEQPKVLYRQHARNVVGAQYGFLRSWATRIRRLRENRGLLPIRAQADEFRRIYGSSLREEHRALLDRFLRDRTTLWERACYALSAEVCRQSRLDDAIMRLLLAAGRL